MFVIYQWIENHLLSPLVMSRTVKLNPLWVLLAVLIGAQLASIVGALFAIPTAGAIQVVVREIFRERKAGKEVAAASGTNGTAPAADPIEAGALL